MKDQQYFEDLFDDGPQFTLKKTQLEFGVNSKFNREDKERFYKEETDIIKKILHLQKAIIAELKATYRQSEEEGRSYYLVDADWVDKWK